MESDLTVLDGRIAELKSKINKMEMLSELEKTDMKNLAGSLYFDTIVGDINKAVSDAIDAYRDNPENRLRVANKILEDIGLEPITGSGMCPEDIFGEYISRF
jgi:hypothetical protein